MDLTNEQMENLKSFLLETFAFTDEQTAAMDQQIPMTQEIFESILERCNELGSAADKTFIGSLKNIRILLTFMGRNLKKK